MKSNLKKLYIVKAGTSFASVLPEHGDFDQWTVNALGPTRLPLEVIDVDPLPPQLPPVEDCAGVAITGAHAMVTDNLDWSLKLEAWLRDLVAAEVPIFGICYGHQLLARACGGSVGFHPLGKEIGTVAVERLEESATDPIFKDLPQTFAAHVTHAQTVFELPPHAIRLAQNDFEPNHAFRLGPCAWGVQFHPEYTSKHAHVYVQEQAEELCETGRDIAAIVETITDTPTAAQLIRNFTAYVETR